MTINFKKGDLFLQSSEALVNTVNCVGVMGKGVALEFKRRWPDNFKKYKELCDHKKLRPGNLYIYEDSDLFGVSGPKYIVNFPTKDHWRAQSKIEYIEAGLDSLVDAIVKREIRSISLPPLGCGNGGLDWRDVKPLIVQKLSPLRDVEITILEPAGAPDMVEHRSAQLSMTYPRAVLLKALGDLEPLFDGVFDRISLQKIVYFLQSLGVPFGLSFKRNLFGPYSEALRKAFVTLERFEMISGFTSESRLAKVTPAAYAMADEFLNEDGRADLANQVIHAFSKLIEGYEGPHGLELLSSVHHLAVEEKTNSIDNVIQSMGDWNEGKRNKFSPAVIADAFERLREDQLIN